MKPPPFAYHAPTSVDEALARLAALGHDGKVLAGGQSLVPLLNMRLVAPRALVDIGRVEGLDGLDVADGRVRFGARVTHERLRRDAAVADAQPLLRRALGWVAHPVIRNRGTSLGSVVHADPAAELPAVLALLGGTVVVAGPDGQREVAIDDLVVGPLEADLRPGELALEARVPVAPVGTGSAIEELARRHGDYALAGVAVTVTVDADRHVTSARAVGIGVGSGTSVVDLTASLAGRAADALETGEAVTGFRDAIAPDPDVHATAEYRRHLAGVLLDRALHAAARDAVARLGDGR